MYKMARRVTYNWDIMYKMARRVTYNGDIVYKMARKVRRVTYNGDTTYKMLDGEEGNLLCTGESDGRGGGFVIVLEVRRHAER